MMNEYIYKEFYGLGFSMIVRIDFKGLESWIPIDEDNSDYQEYLEWLADGNESEVINGPI